MKLMTKELERQIPELYSQEKVEDPLVRAKFFTPWANWTWYVTEYSAVAPDGVERLCFGYVDGLEPELGYFSLDELEEVRGPLGLKIERDLYWTPVPLSEVVASVESGQPV